MRHSLLSLLLLAILTPSNLRAQGEDDPRVEKLYNEAHEQQQRGDVNAAIASYEAILKIAPKLGPAYNNLGALYFRRQDYPKAASTLEQGLKVSPGMPSASALLGISLFQMAEYAQARPRLEAALKANPRDNNAQMYLAKDLLKLGDPAAAAAQLQHLGERDPKNQEVFYLLAKTYMQLSENAFAHMNAIDPNSVLSHQLSAEVMESMNNYDGAVVELKKAVELAPNQPGNHYKLGDAYFSQSQWDSAAEEFNAELAVNPSNCAAYWKSGSVILQKNGDSNEAFNQIDKALSLCPNLADARPDRARALIKLDRNQDAAVDLLMAEKANPAEPGIHFLLAKVYRALGRAEESAAEMKTFSKLDEEARAATAEQAQEVIKNKQAAH